MSKKELYSKDILEWINEAIDLLNGNKLQESYEMIIKALEQNPNAPEPQNLLGLWYELQGDNDMARKHYRAAYALDPTYKSASRNLERVCTIFTSDSKVIDLEDEILKELKEIKTGYRK
ncbi:tetratricopeptide repeat protein [Anaerosacchariphilus polymeriproducens]|uniref:Tetratricopeptide repeat protein n=1 Tax=Anaerosacchariphilus polymeriproducens TaxID=1812858 RepID=A0A371AZ24_9FIRM|nr:tetratricopeptide repeat protein [Anaerosacchariphilus polymeriproducens]RDU24730.1 tetratricopeptide repeat protein [Anaerosacchariphilus polymeriproducens]